MSDEKKIIVDEDWKSRVEAEKQAADDSPAEPKVQIATGDDDPPLPPATFDLLVTRLLSEAMLSLGQIPHPITGEHTVARNRAKFSIDTLAALREKALPGLSPAEADSIEAVLHQLRMAFIELPKP